MVAEITAAEVEADQSETWIVARSLFINPALQILPSLVDVLLLLSF